MSRTPAIILGLALMVALIVGLDVAFLRDHLVLRLIVNVAIVAVFGLLYLSLRRHL